MRIKNTEIKIIQGNILELPAEALVIPADSGMTMGQGLAKAVQGAAGGRIAKEALGKAPLRPGQAVPTNAGKLNSKYLIHAMATDKKGKTTEEILRRACRNVFVQAEELRVVSIIFPALGCCADCREGSCDIGVFPWVGAAKILAQETMKYLREVPTASLKEIIFCLKNDEIRQVFEKNLVGYIRHVQEDLGQGPYVTADAIIEMPQGVVVIERSNPPYGWALPGGFVDYGESLEAAVRREMREETGLELVNLRQFHVYSDPKRDPRFHTVTAVFIAKGKGKPKAGDDAKGLRIVPYRDLLKLKYAFDHKKVMADYLVSTEKAWKL